MAMSGLMATSIEKNLRKMMADKQTGIKQTTGDILSNIGSDNMENTRMIYMPQALTIARRGNPKQLAGDWKGYIKELKTFLRATRRDITSTGLWRANGGQPEHITQVILIVQGTR